VVLFRCGRFAYTAERTLDVSAIHADFGWKCLWSQSKASLYEILVTVVDLTTGLWVANMAIKVSGALPLVHSRNRPARQ
jgi:hypothetical protein